MMILSIRRHTLIIVVLTILMLALVPLVYKIASVKDKKAIPKPEREKEQPSLYGEFLSWEEVDRIFPKYSNATVVDIDTRLQFRVQRRAGTYHADVQPLTVEDTSVMKMLYNGNWSWKRKAIIVQLDNGRRIAASMNGMPHGSGAIRGNNFNGHFCIHFRDSKTHGTQERNLDHQIMIWKAANKLEEQLLSLSPEEVIIVFFTAIDQGEIGIAQKTIDNNSKYATTLLKGIEDIKSIHLSNITNKDQNTFSLDISVSYGDLSRECRTKLQIILINRMNQGWKIDPQSMLPLLQLKLT